MAGGGGGESELNLVPYLDIMINLIMFLLVVTAFIVELKEAPVIVPELNSGSSSEPPPNPEDKKSYLTVAITPRGHSVLSSDGTPPSEVLRNSKGLNYNELTEVLARYKNNPDAKLEEALQIVADKTTPYSEVIGTMDAARKDLKGKSLFPGVQLAVAP